jgi:hypothetical protein
MLNGKSGLESATKACNLRKDTLYQKVYLYALQFDKENKAADEWMKIKKEENEEISQFFLQHFSKDVESLEKNFENDPRNCSLAEELMKFYIQEASPSKAITIANRHIEYRGRSLEVRKMLTSLNVE